MSMLPRLLGSQRLDGKSRFSTTFSTTMSDDDEESDFEGREVSGKQKKRIGENTRAHFPENSGFSGKIGYFSMSATTINSCHPSSSSFT